MPAPRWAQGSPSQHRYRKFRSSRPDPSDWPSDTFILKALGGWSPALSAAGVGVAPDVLTRRLTCRPKACSQEDRRVALLNWISEVDKAERGPDCESGPESDVGLTPASDPESEPGLDSLPALAMVDFRAWLKRERTMSWNTFAKGFPHWHDALLDVGCLERHAVAKRANARVADLPAGQAWLRDVERKLDLTQAPPRDYGTQSARARRAQGLDALDAGALNAGASARLCDR